MERLLSVTFMDVKGHAHVKRALEVAAAGHNIILLGPPDSGKTMIACRLPSILHPVSVAAALEATRLYRAGSQQIPALLLFHLLRLGSRNRGEIVEPTRIHLGGSTPCQRRSGGSARRKTTPRRNI